MTNTCAFPYFVHSVFLFRNQFPPHDARKKMMMMYGQFPKCFPIRCARRMGWEWQKNGSEISKLNYSWRKWEQRRRVSMNSVSVFYSMLATQVATTLFLCADERCSDAPVWVCCVCLWMTGGGGHLMRLAQSLGRQSVWQRARSECDSVSMT